MIGWCFSFLLLKRFEDQQIIKEHEIQKLQHDNLGIANVTLAVDEALENANVNLYERKNIIDQRSKII